jgi:hypothetical protein
MIGTKLGIPSRHTVTPEVKNNTRMGIASSLGT